MFTEATVCPVVTSVLLNFGDCHEVFTSKVPTASLRTVLDPPNWRP